MKLILWLEIVCVAIILTACAKNPDVDIDDIPYAYDNVFVDETTIGYNRDFQPKKKIERHAAEKH